MKKLISFILVFLLGGVTLWAAQQAGFVNLEAREKRALVQKLLIKTDLWSSIDYSIDNMVASLPSSVRSDIRAAIKTDELMTRLVPVYERYLSKETIAGMLEFYETETGKAWLRAQGPIMKDSLTVSKTYTQECISKLK